MLLTMVPACITRGFQATICVPHATQSSKRLSKGTVEKLTGRLDAQHRLSKGIH